MVVCLRNLCRRQAEDSSQKHDCRGKKIIELFMWLKEAIYLDAPPPPISQEHF